MSITGKILSPSSGEKLWEDVLEADLRLFPRPWPRLLWEDLDWERHLLMSWVIADKLLGYALFSHLPADDTAHLLKILLIPEHRGKGEAVLFWRDISHALKERGAKLVYLEVEASNLRAIGLYQKLGFQELRKVKKYYSDGADAVMMQLTL